MKITDAFTRGRSWGCLIGNPHRGTSTRFIREEHGSELVEFAMCSCLLLLMVFGILGCCVALYSYHYCAQMSRDAARYASVRGSTMKGTSCATTATFSCMATSSDVSNFVLSITPLGFSSANLTVTTLWPGQTGSGAACGATNGNNSPGCVVSVKVAYSYPFTMPFRPQMPLALSSTSIRTIAQ